MSATLLTTVDRARRYLAATPPAIAGARGHDRCFATAVALVHGFLLSGPDALTLLREWNQLCQPPWSDPELQHKVQSAFKAAPRKPRGWLLGNRRNIDTSTPEMKRAGWPTFETPSAGDLHRIGEQRNIGTNGLLLAAERELLYTATYKEARCWIVTDTSRRLAQARRMDGQPFRLSDGTLKKALTLPGSIASVPLGLPELESFSNLLLVEGGPDLLAAFHFIAAEGRERDCTAIAMLGASQRIAESSLPAFTGKIVRIFPHIDQSQAGRIAAAHWTRALLPFARKVDGFGFTGCHRIDRTPVKDLNDLCFIDPDEFEENRLLWNLCPA